MLAVSQLAKTFRAAGSGRQAVAAVQDVSLEVAAGSFFTILGPSGCGKSTLLRCVAGLETPDAGEILIDGQTVFSRLKSVELPAVDRPIAMVFQSYAIWPHMTVFDNAAFPLRHGRHRVARPDVHERVVDMLARVGLADFANAWATQLSGGQQQRLALARALLCDPKLLLLDEPLSNLDARLRTAMRAELKEFQRQFGVTTIYVTHDQSEALALSDRVAVMSEGKIQQVGTPEDIYNAPAAAFVASFICNANLIAAQAGNGIFTTVFGMVRSASRAPASEGWLSIRPEHVQLSTVQPDRQTNVFEGRVVTSDFLGDRRECTVDLAGVSLHAIAPADVQLTAGANVWVELPAERTSFLAGDGAIPAAASLV